MFACLEVWKNILIYIDVTSPLHRTLFVEGLGTFSRLFIYSFQPLRCWAVLKFNATLKRQCTGQGESDQSTGCDGQRGVGSAPDVRQEMDETNHISGAHVSLTECGFLRSRITRCGTASSYNNPVGLPATNNIGKGPASWGGRGWRGCC